MRHLHLETFMPTVLVLICFVVVSGMLFWLALQLLLVLLPYLVTALVLWLLWDNRRDLTDLFKPRR